MAHLGEGADLHQPPGSEDGNPLAEGLDLAEDVRGKEYRLAVLLGFGDAVAECLLHEGVEAAGWLIKDEQVGAPHERRNQHQFLAVAFGISSHLFPGIEFESLDELRAVGTVHPTLDIAEELEGLLARQRGPEGCLPRAVRQPFVRLDDVALAVQAEDLRTPRRGLGEAQQQPDRRGLARPVGAEVPDNLTVGHLEREVRHRRDAPVALGQTLGPDRRCGRRAHGHLLICFRIF